MKTIIIIVLAVALCISLLTRPRVIEIRDKKPANGKREIDKVLKLSNELADFVKEDGDEIYIRIVK